MSARRIRRAFRALEDERRMLLRGDLAALGKGAEARRAALSDVLAAGAEATPETRGALREAAERNARRLQAAMSGLRDAQDDIVRRTADRRRIGYGPTGRPTTLAAGPGRERRA